MKSIPIILLSILILFKVSFAQLPTKQWDVRFGGTKQDELRAMKHTADGGYILGGFSASQANGDKSQASQGNDDFWIVKADSNGIKQWDKAFGGSDHDNMISLEVTIDGGFILGGYSKSGISGDKSQASQGVNDYWMVKTDANGIKQWDKRFGGSSNDYLTAIHQTTDGGYILGGYTSSAASGDVSQSKKGLEDYWIVKTDANGIKQWDVRFGGDQPDLLESLAQSNDGGYVLAGTSSSAISGDKTEAVHGYSDYWIVKTDANGLKEWDKTYGGDDSDECSAVASSTDGGYILGGRSFSGIGYDKSQICREWDDYWIVKIDGSGAKQWDRTFGGIDSYGEHLTTLLHTFDGGYLLSGYTGSPSSGEKSQASWGPGSTDYWIIKTDASGNYLWDRRFGGNSTEFCYAALENSYYSFTIGGASHSEADGDKSQENQGIDYLTTDYWLVKTTVPGDIPNIYAGTIVPISLMQGNVFPVPYTVSGTFNPGNTFYAILSMNSGNFDGYDTIGSVNSTTSGTITASIPADVLNGNNYHIRVISSDPETLCPANEEPITVGPYSSVIWDKIYGGTGSDLFDEMIQTSAGGFVFGGYTYSDVSADVSQSSRGFEDYWIIKTDSAGTKQWDARFGSNLADQLSSLIQTSDGGFILGGYSGGAISGDKTQDSRGKVDYWIVKIDANGLKQWDKRFGGSDDDNLTSILQTSDGGYLLGGNSRSPAGFDKSQGNKGIYDDYWIVKTDANGIKQWDVTLGGDDLDDLEDMVATTDDGYLLAGDSRSSVSGDVTDSVGHDFWLVKINENGIKQWDQKYGGLSGSGAIFTSIEPTLDGGFLLSGYVGSLAGYEVSEPGFGENDYWIMKIDSEGNKEWDKRFGGIFSDYDAFAIQTADSGYFVAGSSASMTSGNKTQDSRGDYDYWVVRLNAQHEILWDTRFGGVDNEHLKAAIQTSDGNFLLGGIPTLWAGGDKTQDNYGGNDFWIVKINDAEFVESLVTNSIAPLAYLPDNTVNVPFTASGSFSSGNIFTAQLSNATGGFSSPTTIGSKAGTVSGTITATIPSVPNGTGYRIRVVSSHPAVIGSNNGEDITIGCFTPSGTTTSNITTSSAKLNWNAVEGAIKYKIRYKVAGNNPWTTIYSSSTSKRISGLSANTTYTWQVKSVCSLVPSIESPWSAKQNFITSLRISDQSVTSTLEVYPNPFSPDQSGYTTISFFPEENSHTILELFDLTGRKVKTLLDENSEAGDREVFLHREHLSNGVYLLRMRTSNQTLTTKIVIE